MALKKAGQVAAGTPAKNKTCFVAMPFGGSDADARATYIGWYDGVIKPAIEDAGLEPFLSIAQDAPIKITDDVRTHLVEDAVAVFDLGGVAPDSTPNPNVTYELGIRHAFGLPAVLYAWNAALLPFDVTEQHAVIHPRTVAHVSEVRIRLTKFITASLAGNFYKPMEAVGQAKMLESVGRGNDALAVIARELQSMKSDFAEMRALQIRSSWDDLFPELRPGRPGRPTTPVGAQTVPRVTLTLSQYLASLESVAENSTSATTPPQPESEDKENGGNK